jgi:L-lactate dehydrogenase complex protein LldG
MSSRDEILNKLREGRAARPHNAFPEPDWSADVFPMPTDLLATFVAELETIGGKAVVGESEQELVEKLQKMLEERGIGSVFCIDGEVQAIIGDRIRLDSDQSLFLSMQASATRCEVLVARTGSILVSSAHPSGRQLNFYPPVHIVFAKASQLVPFVDNALAEMTKKYGKELPSMISMITGSSRTADIEKTLVMGAHGPKELIVLVNRTA